MSRRVLSEHLARTRQRLLGYAEHVGILAEHGDVRGAAREGIIHLFLQENLPSLVEFKTGEILDCNDKRSGQLDIVLQSIAAPRIPIFDHIQTTMADAALGVIEVKSGLDTASWGESSHLERALNTFRKVKSLERNTHIEAIVGPYFKEHRHLEEIRVIFSSTPCFLVAYKGPTMKTLHEKLLGYGQHFGLSLDEYAPEVVCVLDRDYSIVRDDGWLVPKEGREFLDLDEVYGSCLVGIFVYICRIVEAWNATYHSTNLIRYFELLGQNL